MDVRGSVSVVCAGEGGQSFFKKSCIKSIFFKKNVESNFKKLLSSAEFSDAVFLMFAGLHSHVFSEKPWRSSYFC